MFNKIWAKWIVLTTQEEYQGIIVLRINQTLEEYANENNIRIIDHD